MEACPLCFYSDTKELFRIKVMRVVKPFYECPHCSLVYVPEKFHMAREDEVAQYKMHENDSSNEGYLQLLKPAIDKALELTVEGERILDFGCGPGPVLANYLQEKGRKVEKYDPLFFPETPSGDFSLITCTEVVEHFKRPREDWETLINSVSGKLIVLTSLRDSVTDLESWGYLREASHVSFYSVETMEWIANHFEMEVPEISQNLTVFTKTT